MVEQGNPAGESPSLSEISHLFLTGLRERQSAGPIRPERRPPWATDRPRVSVDLTPREFARGLEADAAIDAPDNDEREKISAVLGNHLGPAAINGVRQYARAVASRAGRVGLIELNEQGIRLTCFDGSPLAADQDLTEAAGPEAVDARRIEQAIEEMGWDVDEWLVFLADGAGSPKSRQMLASIENWTLLVTADDAGVVAAYRALKAAAAIGKAAVSAAILNAEDKAHEEIIHRKLSGASQQFLRRTVGEDSASAQGKNVLEHVALWCRAGGTDAHWAPVSEWVQRARQTPESPAPRPTMRIAPAAAPLPAPQAAFAQPAAAPPAPVEPAAPRMRIADAMPAVEAPPPANGIMPEIMEVDHSCDSAAILAAVMKKQSQWIACPVRPPMCAASCVAVDRGGRLHLLACGLAELRAVSRAYGWLQENRDLVKMAVPQMNIDPAAVPQLTLFVDQSEVDAHELGAILRSGHVTIQTYRRLRWGERTGLLLEAA